jgi:hypothetical protein
MARDLQPGEFVLYWGDLCRVTRKNAGEPYADLLEVDQYGRLSRWRLVHVKNLTRHEPTEEELARFLARYLEES